MDDIHLIEKTAVDFWGLSDLQPTYPCDLEAAISWALPITIQYIPALQVAHIRSLAQNLGIKCRFADRNRRLRGCLIAYQDNAIVLIDSNDPPDEQRFTLAHELAHFLLDYLEPRQRALLSLGEQIRPILDGIRPPTIEERMHAVLASAPLGVLSHLMERPDHGIAPTVVLAVEDRADRLALELLAPASTVLARQTALAPPVLYDAKLSHLAALLTSEYGLPHNIAAAYATTLLRLRGGPTFRDWLLGRTK